MGIFNKRKERSSLPTQTMLYIRMIVAGYLLYLSYDLFTTREASSMPLWVLLIILAVFVVCSVIIIAHCIYLLVKGLYAGGKADISQSVDADETK